MAKKVGAIDTQTLLLIGAGVVAVYLITKPKTATPIYQPYPYQTALQAQQVQSGNTTASIVSSAGPALASVINALANAF